MKKDDASSIMRKPGTANHGNDADTVTAAGSVRSFAMARDEKDIFDGISEMLSAVVVILIIALIFTQVCISIGDAPMFGPPKPTASVLAPNNGETSFSPPLPTPAGSDIPAPLFK